MSKQKGGARVLGFGPTWIRGAALACVLPGVALGQGASGASDAQVEANVLKALAAAPELSTQDIQSSTVYGVVTLSGSVQTESLRTRAENLVARAPGVKKVVDEMTLGAQARVNTPSPGEGESNPSYPEQSAQADPQYGSNGPTEPATPYAGPPPQSYPAQGNQDQNAATVQRGGYPAPNANGGYPSYPQPGYGPANSGYGQQPYSGSAPVQAGSVPYSAQGYGQPQPGAAYGPPQAYPAQPGYAPGGGQPGGVAVVVPAGTLLRIRINRGIDSNHIQPGVPWDGTVLSDVAAGGLIAIPRGASVQGVVVDSKKAGALKGGGELALQVTHVQLGGAEFPLPTDIWAHEGGDKSLRTVNSAIGLGVLGAIVGGVAGGGAGAAVGAGVGAGVGVAGSAASPGGRVIVPPESVLTFRMAQPVQVVTVSQQEMQRLAYAAGPGVVPHPVVRRRYYPGYPGPGYYAPAPYPYPY